MKDIQQIKEFNISKADNGYVVKVQYEKVPEEGRSWGMNEYSTLIAKDLPELNAHIEAWFARVV